jgi:hypothetical protein
MTINSDNHKRIIERFIRRFDKEGSKSYRQLVYYAALPLVITPELLNYLHTKFLRGRVPWVAQADLLLSELCDPTGYEMYTMEPALRDYLLQEMKQTEDAAKMQEVARFLLSYVYHLWHTGSFVSTRDLQAQRWAAMAFIDDERENVVHEIATSFLENIKANEKKQQANQAEMIRLSRITQMLAPQLQEHPHILEYAQDVTNWFRKKKSKRLNNSVLYEILGLSTIKVTVEIGDVLKFKTDVLALKYPQKVKGITQSVVNRLSKDNKDFIKLLPKVSEIQLINSKGKIGADFLMFVGIKSRISEFGYPEIQSFVQKILVSLAKKAPNIQHLCFTIHGPRYGLNEIKALEAEITGLIEAITEGNFPKNLKRITIVERKTERAKNLKIALSHILPEGYIQVPQVLKNSEIKAELYKDWYKYFNESEDIKHTNQSKSIIPSVDTLKKLFEKWINKHKQEISEQLCEQYCQKKQQFQNKESLLIAGVTDGLAVILAGIPVNSVVVATILVADRFLDRICDCSKYEE